MHVDPAARQPANLVLCNFVVTRKEVAYGDWPAVVAATVVGRTFSRIEGGFGY
jgi:hypothetical protein